MMFKLTKVQDLLENPEYIYGTFGKSATFNTLKVQYDH